MPKCCIFGGPPVITYLGQGSGPFNIGPARADRVIVGFWVFENDGASNIGTQNINGVGATMDYNPTTSDSFGVGHAVVPTGTTVTTSGAQAVYMITGLANNALYSSQGNGAQSQSISTPAGFSAVIAGGRGRTGSAPHGVTGTGAASSVAADATQNNGGGSNPAWVVGSGVANGADTVTITETNGMSSPVCWAGCFY